MRAIALIQKSTAEALSSVHGHRKKTFWWCMESLIHGGKLILTELGRNGAGLAYVKHKVKRADRFIGNERFVQDVFGFYWALAQWLLKDVRRPIILIDWTSSGLGHYALVATLPLSGRAVTLYAEVHEESLLGNREVQQQFLESLAALLPACCQPIIVTDAGFHTSWFDAVRTLEWHFVGRMRHMRRYYTARRDWRPIKNLYRQASKSPKCLGEKFVTESKPRSYRIVVVRKPPKNRKHINKNDKTISRQTTSRKYAQRKSEPWLLATNLQAKSAKKIVAIYALRMQAEETFRDIKSHRTGWSFNDARSSSKERLNVLWLIATYAHFALLLTGMAIKTADLHKRLLANTNTDQAFSLAFIATLWLRTKQTIPIDALKGPLVEARCLFEGD